MTTNNKKAYGVPLRLLPAGRKTRRSILAACIAVLATFYGVTGIFWEISGQPFPVGDADPYSSSLLFNAPSAAVGRGLVALAGIAGLLAVLSATGGRKAKPPVGLRAAVAAMAVVMCLVAMVLVGDARLLSVLGYLPVILAKVSYDPQIQEAMPRLLDASLLNLLALATGAALWVALAVEVDRNYRGACQRCGRNEATVHGPFSAASAARWGRVAVLIAVTVPLVYAVTRICWAFGFPLGVDTAVQDDMVSRGMDTSALGLGGMALAGAVLTLGLVQRWGEAFPRWIPGLAGKRVPISLAVVPATFVAMAIIPASVTMIMMAGMPSGGIIPAFSPSNWAPFGPAFLWPLWGVALAAAALAYYLRRRGTCRDCHRNG
jgi:hypothetical protein